MKYIFVCNYGLNRSPVAAKVAREMGLERGVELETEFMALFPEESAEYEEKARVRLEEADRIFVMTPEMKDILRARYWTSPRKITCLNVEDDYDCSGTCGPQIRVMLENELRKRLKRILFKNPKMARG